MYRGSYNNNQVTNGSLPPHQHHQQQQFSDAYGQQPPPQQSYYQAQQQGQGQYGGQFTGNAVSRGEYPRQDTHHHQQQQGYLLEAAHLAGSGSGGGGGYNSASVPGPGLSTDAYTSYGRPPPQQEPHDQYQYRNTPGGAAAPGVPLRGLHPPQQEQRQHEGVAPSPAYNQSIPAPTHISTARMDSLLPQHYKQQQQQHQNYPAFPHPQHREHHSTYPHLPHATAAAAAANPPPVPMHRAREDPYYQYQQPGHSYGQRQGPAPPLVQQQPQPQLQRQQLQYTRYELEHPSSDGNARNRGGGGGPGGQYALETRKEHSYHSTGNGDGDDGGGGRHLKKRSRRHVAAPAAITATSMYDKKKRHHKQHHSSRSPAPTDSQIRLSPAVEQKGGFPPGTVADEAQYAVHLPAYQLGATLSMDYIETSRRFERLVMPEDFIEMNRPHHQQHQQQHSAGAQHVVLSTSDDDEKMASIDGLGLSEVLHLNGCLPVHHEICTEKVENDSSLALYDPEPRTVALFTSLSTPRAPDTAAIPYSNELPIIYNAKVVLISGLREVDQHAILSKYSPASASSPSTSSDSDHLSCRLKFVVARAERAGTKSGIFALGGRVDPTIDGNPNPNMLSSSPMDNNDCSNHRSSKEKERVLIGAAKRHFLIQTGVDLSPCQRWNKVLEIKYYRPGRETSETEVVDGTVNTVNKNNATLENFIEVTVIFVVDDGHRAVPSQEDWAAAWENRHTQPRTIDTSSDARAEIQEHEEKNVENEEEKEAGAAAVVVVVDDCEEGELPETASPLLKSTMKTTSKVVQMPPDPRLLFIGLNNQKLRLKTMSISLDGLLDYNESDLEEATFELSLFAETMHEMLSRDAGITIYKALVQKPWEKEKIFIKSGGGGGEDHQGLFFAFSYFDAGGLGYIRTEDLQTIIESLGLHLHHGYVKELCQKAAEASGSSGKKSADGSCGSRVEYSKLCVP